MTTKELALMACNQPLILLPNKGIENQRAVDNSLFIYASDIERFNLQTLA